MDDGADEAADRAGSDEEVREVDPREAQRIRRRDRDLEAEQRALLRAGMGKVFKQIQDAQRKAADELGGGPSQPAAKPGPGRRGRG